MIAPGQARAVLEAWESRETDIPWCPSREDRAVDDMAIPAISTIAGMHAEYKVAMLDKHGAVANVLDPIYPSAEAATARVQRFLPKYRKHFCIVRRYVTEPEVIAP